MPGHDEGGAGRVVEDGARLVGERVVGGEVGHVDLGVAEQHADDVRALDVLVVLGEVEAVPHGEQVVQRDGMAGIGRVGPLGDRCSARPSANAALAHEDTHGRVQDRLGHRPRQQLGGGADRLVGAVPVLELAAVALGEQRPALDDGDGIGLPNRAIAA